MTWKANPSWWGDKPQFDEVVFRIIPDAAGRIETSGRARAGSVPSTRSAFIKFNTEKAPLDNKLFRQALNYAVDKDAIAKALFDGRAQVSSCQILTKDYFGFNPALRAYPYYPDKAVALLKQSGVSLSQPIELEVASNTYLNGEGVVQVVAEQLSAIGMQTKIVEMQYGTWMDRCLKTKVLGRMGLASFAPPSTRRWRMAARPPIRPSVRRLTNRRRL